MHDVQQSCMTTYMLHHTHVHVLVTTWRLARQTPCCLTWDGIL